MRVWLGLIMAALSAPALALEVLTVEAITDQANPFTNSVRLQEALNGNVLISTHSLDSASELESELGADLPATEAEARPIVEARIAAMGDAALKSRATAAYAGLITALKYGVDRYPAIIFNGDAVVYGETDLVAAWRRYNAWTQNQ